MKTLLDKEELVFNPPELGYVLSLPGFPGGGSRIYDRSPYGNIGTITGAGWQRLPSGLWCLSFDGTDDYVNCGNKSSLDITDAITLETWVKVTDDTKQFPKIIAKYETYELYLHAATMKIRGTFYTAGGVVDKYGTQVLVQDAWYYLVITYDSTTMHAYINAVEDTLHDGGAQNIGAIKVTAADVVLGLRSAGGGNPFAGSIALTRVYNGILTPFDVQNHFNREKHLFGVW